MFARFQLFLLALVGINVIEEGSALCTKGSYLNLCGLCVGRTTDKNELDGLDRCNVCGGKSDCVGCDGIINSPRRRDSCGLCLPPQAKEWNDCLIIDNVYPSLLDLSLDNGLVPLIILGAGLKQSYVNTTQCLIQPLESQYISPTIKETSLYENKIQIKVELTESTGAYRIGCSEIEGFVELHIVDSRKLNAIKVEPADVEVDKKVEMEIRLEKDVSLNSTVWCFVRVSPGEVATLTALRKSENLISCSGHIPLTPGVMKVGIVANEDTAFRENGTGKTVELFVRAKPPIAETAEYTPDFQRIVVRFDQNIEIANCNGTFSPETEKYLGKGFTCTTSGDALHVTLGDESELPETITIVSGNNIHRSLIAGNELSPSAAAATLPLSKEKGRTPTLSLSLPNMVCADKTKQPSVNVAVTKLGGQKMDYVWTVPPLREWKGRNQRENMLMWRNVRAVEAELSNSSHPDGIIISRENLLPGIKYDISLRSSSSSNNDITASFTISEIENISVTVKAFPSASAIVAEVSITICNDAAKQHTLRYKWFVDDNLIMEDGRLLYIPHASLGTHNISCVVFSYESGHVLGRGWTVVQVVTLPEQTVIFPTEIVVGTMDPIAIQAYSRENQWEWSCATELGEPCITVGPKSRPIDEVIDVKSLAILIPAGTLPVGKYKWTFYGNRESTATVIISPRIPPILKLAPPKPVIDVAKPLTLNADVERLKSGCKIQWKVMRRKGYDYFDLQDDVGLGDLIQVRADDLMTEEREVPLILPAAKGNWKGLLGGASYLFRLEAICPDPLTTAHVDVSVVANAPPQTSNLFITPDVGEAINTKFALELKEGSDNIEDYPLFHHLSFKDETNDEILLATSVSTKFDVYLASGNITLIVKSCDRHDSCSTSSKSFTVQEPSDVTPQNIAILRHEIRSSMLCGDSTTAYGIIISTLKSLSKNAKFKQKMDEITSAAESAVKEKLQDLTERLRSDPSIIKYSFEFLEQSVSSLKYFPETKDMVKELTEFKNLLTLHQGPERPERRERVQEELVDSLSRKKRETDKELSIIKINERTIKAIFDLHAKILEQNNTKNNREEFLKDVRKYMVDVCSAVQDFGQFPTFIESSIITLEVIKINPNELKNDITLSSIPNIKVKFNLKALSRKTCAAFAKYNVDYLENTTINRISDVLEVRLIKNGTFKEDNIKSVTVTIPIYSQENMSCMSWSNGWNSSCNLKAKTETTVSCSCKSTGIFAAFVKDKAIEKPTTLGNATVSTTATPALLIRTDSSSVGDVTIAISSANTKIVTTTSTTHKITTANIGTTATKITATNSRAVVTSTTISMQNITTTTTQNSTPTTMMTTGEMAIVTSIEENRVTIRDRNSSFYISGTFKINEDFDEIVGKNMTVFENSLRQQLAEQLKVSVACIANLIVKPGSIIVTVLFVDSDGSKAETAVKELITLLHDGILKLTGPNSKVLNILPQDLKVKIATSSTKNTGKMRLIAYGVVAGSFITIFLFAAGAAYLKRKRTRMPLRLPHLSIDDHPTYRQFHNEFSLDGSSDSLARYRRNHPFETESIQ